MPDHLGITIWNDALPLLERCADELAGLMTPWEPFDRLLKLCTTRPFGDQLNVPWPLVPSFILLLRHAADTCAPRLAGEIAGRLIWTTARLEARAAVDRLADVL